VWPAPSDPAPAVNSAASDGGSHNEDSKVGFWSAVRTRAALIGWLKAANNRRTPKRPGADCEVLVGVSV